MQPNSQRIPIRRTKDSTISPWAMLRLVLELNSPCHVQHSSKLVGILEAKCISNWISNNRIRVKWLVLGRNQKALGVFGGHLLGIHSDVLHSRKTLQENDSVAGEGASTRECQTATIRLPGSRHPSSAQEHDQAAAGGHLLQEAAFRHLWIVRDRHQHQEGKTHINHCTIQHLQISIPALVSVSLNFDDAIPSWWAYGPSTKNPRGIWSTQKRCWRNPRRMRSPKELAPCTSSISSDCVVPRSTPSTSMPSKRRTWRAKSRPNGRGRWKRSNSLQLLCSSIAGELLLKLHRYTTTQSQKSYPIYLVLLLWSVFLSLPFWSEFEVWIVCMHVISRLSTRRMQCSGKYSQLRSLGRLCGTTWRSRYTPEWFERVSSTSQCSWPCYSTWFRLLSFRLSPLSTTSSRSFRSSKPSSTLPQLTPSCRWTVKFQTAHDLNFFIFKNMIWFFLSPYALSFDLVSVFFAGLLAPGCASRVHGAAAITAAVLFAAGMHPISEPFGASSVWKILLLHRLQCVPGCHTLWDHLLLSGWIQRTYQQQKLLGEQCCESVRDQAAPCCCVFHHLRCPTVSPSSPSIFPFFGWLDLMNHSYSRPLLPF